jgi:hypothetical protein
MCNHDHDDPFAGLEHDLQPATKTPSRIEREKIRYTCDACGGSGKYRGLRTRQTEDHCFACGGRGYHLVHPDKRRAANAKRKATIARKRDQAIATNAATGLLDELRGMSSWNSFAADLLRSHSDGRVWSERQIEAAEKMIAKVHLKREERAKAATTKVGDVSRIRQMFDSALAAGKKRRALLAARIERDENDNPVLDDTGKARVLNDIKLTPAREPRTEIWVKVDGEFAGGINEDGGFKKNWNAPEWLAAELERLAANPEKETRLYGQVTGNCCCCGRELTNEASIEAGIGPVCAQKWGV